MEQEILPCDLCVGHNLADKPSLRERILASRGRMKKCLGVREKILTGIEINELWLDQERQTTIGRFVLHYEERCPAGASDTIPIREFRTESTVQERENS